MSLSYPRRGALEIVLASPASRSEDGEESSSTLSQLLTARPEDNDSEEGFHDWGFSSVHFWGEMPKGRWTLYVVDKVRRIKA